MLLWTFLHIPFPTLPPPSLSLEPSDFSPVITKPRVLKAPSARPESHSFPPRSPGGIMAKSTRRERAPGIWKAARSSEEELFLKGGDPKLSLHGLSVPSDGERRAVPQGERPKPRPHPRPPEVDSKRPREFRASASPPRATRASVSPATPPLPEAAPAPPPWPPAREPASRPGPRRSSCSPPPRLGRGARAHSRPRAGREVPGEPPGPAPTKAGSTPACESARGPGEPVPAACLVPAAEPPRRPHSAPSRRRPATPRREARRKGVSAGSSPLSRSPAGGTPCERASRSARWPGLPTRSGARPARPRRLPPGTSPRRVRPPARSPARSLPGSLARSDSGRGQRLSLSARRGSRRSA